MFTSGATAALIKDEFPEQAGVVVSQDTPKSKEPSEVMDYLSDVSLMELEPEPEPEPVPENPERKVSVVEKEMEKEKDKNELPVDSVGSNCKSLTAPDCPRRKPKKCSKPCTQDMIIKGTSYMDSEPEPIEDGFLLLGLTSNVADLV